MSGKTGAGSLENNAMYDVLVSNGCRIDIPVSNPTLSEEEAYKEAVQMIEAWAHEHNNTTDSFVEYSISKKIQVFCNNGPRTVGFFKDFLTYLIYTGDPDDWDIFKKIYSAVASKKCIKYLWTTRFNLLSYLNKKEFLYKSLKKLYVSTEQATSLSPKFFGKQVDEVMSTFVADLNSNSIKIRNKDVISVAKWSELLFSRFLAENQTAIIPYINTKKTQGSTSGFIAKCFQDFEHIEYQQKEIDKIVKLKEEESKTKPKDLYRGIYHAHAGSSEIKHLINKGNPEVQKSKRSEGTGDKDLTSMERKAFAMNRTAIYNISKTTKQSNDGEKNNSFMAYFAKTRFLEPFREHENFHKRAMMRDMDITKHYDFKPNHDFIQGAFRSCLVQKNRGKFPGVFLATLDPPQKPATKSRSPTKKPSTAKN